MPVTDWIPGMLRPTEARTKEPTSEDPVDPCDSENPKTPSDPNGPFELRSPVESTRPAERRYPLNSEPLSPAGSVLEAFTSSERSNEEVGTNTPDSIEFAEDGEGQLGSPLASVAPSAVGESENPGPSSAESNHEPAGPILYEEYQTHEAYKEEIQMLRATARRHQGNDQKTRNDLEKVMKENESLKSQLEHFQSTSSTRSQAGRGEVNNPSFGGNGEGEVSRGRTRAEYESMYTQLPRNIKYVTVEMALMTADASMILRDWKEMEQHCSWALKEAGDLHDLPLTSLCHFTMGIALYNQRKWGLAFEAFRNAGPCKDVHKTSEEVEEWLRKAQRAGEASSATSAFPSSSGLVSAMPMSSIPKSGASVTTPSNWESLAGFDSAGPMSGQTPGTPWNPQERERHTPLASGGLGAEEPPSTHEIRDFAFERNPINHQTLPPRLVPSPSRTSVAENNVVRTLDPNSSSLNDNIDNSSELRSPRPSPFHPSSLKLNTPLFPRTRSPLYVPSSTPSPPPTRHSSPLVQYQENPNRSTNLPSRSRSPLMQAHSHLDPSNLSKDDILRLRWGQRINVSQTQSPRSRRGIEWRLHSNNVPKRGILKRRSTTVGERPAAVEEEDEDTEGSDAAAPVMFGQGLHPEPRRGHRRQQSKSFSGASNVTWDELDPPTVQSEVDQIIESRADVLRQWRRYHPDAIDRSHLLAESGMAIDKGNMVVADRDHSSPTNQRRRSYSGGESDLSSESSPPSENENRTSSGRSEDGRTLFTAKPEQPSSTRPRLGSELWSPNDADDEEGDVSGGSGDSPDTGGSGESGADGEIDASGASTKTVVDEDSPYHDGHEDTATNGGNDEGGANGESDESGASTKAVADSDSPYSDGRDESDASTKAVVDEDSPGNGESDESGATTKAVVDEDSPGNGWSDEGLINYGSDESDTSMKTVIDIRSSDQEERSPNSDAWCPEDGESGPGEEPRGLDEEIGSPEHQEEETPEEERTSRRSEMTDNMPWSSRIRSNLAGERSNAEGIGEKEENRLSEAENINSELRTLGFTSPNNESSEMNDDEPSPGEELISERSSKKDPEVSPQTHSTSGRSSPEGITLK